MSESSASPRRSSALRQQQKKKKKQQQQRAEEGGGGPPTAPRRRHLESPGSTRESPRGRVVDRASSSTTTRSSRSASPAGGGSYASATSSSLLHGGPSSNAPPPRLPPSGGGGGGGSTPRTGVLPSSSSSISISISNAIETKENATEQDSNRRPSFTRHDDRDGGMMASTTPTKKETTSSTTNDGEEMPKAILSPTPYWRVLEGRDGGKTRTSPRTTRSSTKARGGRDGHGGIFNGEDKQDDDVLADVDDDDDRHNHDDDDEGGASSLLLHFSTPPECRMQIQSARNARRRLDAEQERERIRHERIRKRNEGMMSRGLGEIGGGIVGGGHGGRRASKRTRREGSMGVTATMKGEENEEYDGDATTTTGTATVTTIVGPSAEDLRRIVEESLAGHESSRVEGLVSKIAGLERDVAHKDEMHEVLLSKYDALRSRVEVRDGSDDDMRRTLAEQRDAIEGYAMEIRRLVEEKHIMEERHEMEREEFERERREMEVVLSEEREAHASELRRTMDEATSSSRGSHDRLVEEYNAIKDELASARSEIDDSNRRIEGLDAENEAARDALMHCISELERAKAELELLLEKEKRDNDVNRATIVSLESNMTGHLGTITRQEDSISRLEDEVRAITMALDDAKREMEGMQSPRSRDALEQEYSKEVSELEGKLAAAEAERADMLNILREKDEAYLAMRGELNASEVERDQLSTRLSHTSSAVDEVKAKAATLKLKVQQLSEEVRATNAKREENEAMLEEMAEENEQLLARLEASESAMLNRLLEAQTSKDEQAREMASKHAATVAEKDALVEDLNSAQDTIANLHAQMKTLDEELATSQQHITSLQTNKIASDRKLTELSSQLQALTDHLESTQLTIAALEAKLRAKDEYCEQFETMERRLIEEKRVLNEIRANLHNRVIQLCGNIRVFVRVRPIVESERRLTSEGQQNAKYNWGGGSRPSSRGSMGPTGGRPPSRESSDDADDDGCPFHFPSITDRNTHPSASDPGCVGAKSSSNYTSYKDLTKQVIELTEPYKDRGGLKDRRKKWKYGFDRVFSQDHGQDDVWEGAEPLVQSCIDGFQVSMFAYGQTGSGKTHTMIGVEGDRGLIPRAVTKLFEAKREIEHGGQELVNISVEMLEIYNEEVRDLLEYNAGPDGQLIKLKLSSNEAVGNVKVNARDEQEVGGILKLAQERRCVKATKVNAESSRSHLLFTIHFNGSSVGDASVSTRSGCLHIVDLAGSERLDKSGSHGALLTEAKHINTSLSALALVIEKLQARKKTDSEHIPYRDSKLTYLLRNSLGGDSKTLAIVCCSPHQSHFNESLNSIRFAAKASKVELKEANTLAV